MSHDLHNAIMNIPCAPGMLNLNHHAAYKMGHRDARHAAAEMALSATQSTQAPDLSDAEILQIIKLCRREDPEVPGWISRQRINWCRAVLAARSAKS